MSKEEIYLKHLKAELNGRDLNSPAVAAYCKPEQTIAAYKAMDELSKGFGEWIGRKSCRTIDRAGTKWSKGIYNEGMFTIDELFNQYIESLKTK